MLSSRCEGTHRDADHVPEERKQNEPKHNYHFRDEEGLSSAVGFSSRSVVAICSASHVNVIGEILSRNGRTRSAASTRQRTMRIVPRAADNPREKVRIVRGDSSDDFPAQRGAWADHERSEWSRESRRVDTAGLSKNAVTSIDGTP